MGAEGARGREGRQRPPPPPPQPLGCSPRRSAAGRCPPPAGECSPPARPGRMQRSAPAARGGEVLGKPQAGPPAVPLCRQWAAGGGGLPPRREVQPGAEGTPPAICRVRRGCSSPAGAARGGWLPAAAHLGQPRFVGQMRAPLLDQLDSWTHCSLQGFGHRGASPGRGEIQGSFPGTKFWPGCVLPGACGRFTCCPGRRQPRLSLAAASLLAFLLLKKLPESPPLLPSLPGGPLLLPDLPAHHFTRPFPPLAFFTSPKWQRGERMQSQMEGEGPFSFQDALRHSPLTCPLWCEHLMS